MSHSAARILLAALTVIASACSSADPGANNTNPPPPPSSPGISIGAAGGTVSGPTGVSVVFPAGALTAATSITVAATTGPGVAGAGTAYDLGPTGTQFAVPAILTLPYGSLPAGTPDSIIRLFTLVGGSWHSVPSVVNASAHTVSGYIDHFSQWVSCPMPCDADGTTFMPVIDLFNVALPSGTSLVINGGLQAFYYGGPDPTVTVEGLPSGVTGQVVTHGPSHFGGMGMTVTLTAAAGVAPGWYHYTLRYHSSLPDEESLFDLQVVAPAFTVAASPQAINLIQGSSATSTLTAARIGNFTSNVGLVAENLPSGVTASFSPSSISGTTSVVTFHATGSATLGNASVDVRATAPGFPTVTIPFDFTVSSVNGSGFTAIATPATVHLSPGGSAATTLQATRIGSFSGAIVFANGTLPNGITSTISATGTDAATVTIHAASTVTIGDYPVQILATSGSTSVPITVTASVAALGHVQVHLDYTVCAASSRPIWVAYQDGSGAFVHDSGSGDTYDFTLSQPTGAIALVKPSGSGYSTTVTNGTQAELASYSSQINCGTTQAGKTITASVTNAGTAPAVDVSLGSAFEPIEISNGNGSSPISNVPTGAQDVSAMLMSTSPKVIVRRGQTIADGGTAAFDFSSAEAVAPASATMGVAPSLVAVLYTSTAAACVSSFSTLYVSGAYGSVFYGLPAAQQQSGDLYELAAELGNSTAVNVFHTFGGQTLSFGAGIAPGVSSEGTLPYHRLGVTMTVPSDYQFVQLRVQDQFSDNSYAVIGTTTWSGSSSVHLVMPDLSAVDGFQASWVPSGAIAWTVLANSVDELSQPFAVCIDGARIKSTQVSGTM